MEHLTPITRPDRRRVVLGLVGVLGTLLFSLAFLITLRTPERLEHFAADYIEARATEALAERVDGWARPAPGHALNDLAADLLRRDEREIAALEASLRSGVHRRIAAAIAEMRDLDCECRERWADALHGRAERRIDTLVERSAPLRRSVHATYARIVADLARDVRVFSGTNALVFALLFAAAFARPRAVLQLFVPGVMLAAAALSCSYLYLFEQNWLLTIIQESYLGFWYLAWLAFAFGLLLDIGLNRARITTEIVNSMFQALGHAATAVPC